MDGAGVGLRLRAGVAGFAGVATCGSVWADPVCNAKVMSRRALEIGAAVALWQAQGGQVVLVTLTMRHHWGQPLDGLWDVLSYAWSRTTMGKPWQSDRDRFGIAGYMRAVEVTWGRNGWHPHPHALLFIEAGAPVDPLALHGRLFDRWARAVGRKGASALSMAQDVKVLTGPADEVLAEYLTKATDHAGRIGLEVSWSQGKKARGVLKTETPWRLLDLVQEGDADALDMWHEWEKASQGRRMHTWSQGIRDRLGLGAERSDDEIAGEEIGTKEDELLRITARGWAALCSDPIKLAQLLDVTESFGMTGARVFLQSRGIEYLTEER